MLSTPAPDGKVMMLRAFAVMTALSLWACSTCKLPGDACCEPSRCDNNLTCSHDVCVPSTPLTDVGKFCSRDSSCQSGLCTSIGGASVCTAPCGGDSDCVAGWTCGASRTGAKTCQCAKAAEVCDGKDNDCDGKVDAEPAALLCIGTLGPSSVCTETGCVCHGVMCDGLCTDVGTDPSNCGACGAACPSVEGGTVACVAGICGKHEIVQPGAVDPKHHIAASATDVFWSDGQKLCQTTLATKVVIYFETLPYDDIAVNGTSLFWTGNGAISSEPLTHGPIESFGTGPTVFALNSTTLFWTDAYGRVFSAPSQGGATTRVTSGLPAPVTMVADETHLFWIDQQGALRSIPVSGGSPTTLVDDAFANPGRIGVDSDFVYWASNGFGSGPASGATSQVMKVPRSGGAPVVFADGASQQQRFSNILVEGDQVYWQTATNFVVGGDTRIVRAPRAGGAPIALVTLPSLAFNSYSSSLDGVSDFTLDPTGVVYVANGGHLGVYRVSPR